MIWCSSAGMVVSSAFCLFCLGWPGGRLLEWWCPQLFLFVLFGMTWWSSAGMVVSSAFFFVLFCLGWPGGRLLGWWCPQLFVCFVCDDLVVVCWDGGVLSFCLFCLGWPGGRLLGWWCPQFFVCFVLDDLVVVCWDDGVLSFLFVLFGITWWSSAGMVVSSVFCLFCLGWPGGRLLGWCPPGFPLVSCCFLCRPLCLRSFPVCCLVWYVEFNCLRYWSSLPFEPRHEKICLRGFRPSKT